jgi:hypothetical protein
MTKGFDTSTTLSAAKAKEFANKGNQFVCRYLAPKSWNSWKALTAEEAQYITDAGMEIVSAWETTAGAAGQGNDAGKEAGIFALQSAKEVGQPEGSKVYFCVDFEANKNQYEAIADYFIAAKQELTGYEIDGYGNDAILDFLKSRGIIRNGWQTIAYSYGRKSKGISIYQNNCGPNGNGFPMCGIGIDADESYGNEGWWNTMQISKADANKVIGLLGEAYKLGITHIPLPDGTVATVDQTEIHRLANVQRIASGQPTT